MNGMRLSELAPTVWFGASGVRALVADLSPTVVATYARAFIQHLRISGQLAAQTCVVGWDLRPSSPAIDAAVGAALVQDGLQVDWAGQVPTPVSRTRTRI